MQIKLILTEVSAIQGMLTRYVAQLASPIDSFLEDHILQANHYRILLDGATAGYCSVHKATLLTQYYLHDEYKRYGQLVFQQLKKLESVQAAFVPTADEFFLAHALDEYKQLEKQAYFFQTTANPSVSPFATNLSGRLARGADIPFIQAQAGDFFDDVEREIQQSHLYCIEREASCVGFGVLVKSELCPTWASIGMYTIPAFRHQGVGRTIIRYLINECHQQKLTPIAGCWYYNHLSKKTLESAGMYTQTRLLKISY